MPALSAALLSNFTKRRFHESYLSFRDDSRVQQLTIMVNLVASFPLVGDPGTKLVKVWDIFQSLSCKSSAAMLACAHFLATLASSVLKPKWGVPNWPFLKSLSSSSFVTVGSVWPVFLAGFLNFSSWLLELYETSQIPCQQGMEICHWKGTSEGFVVNQTACQVLTSCHQFCGHP